MGLYCDVLEGRTQQSIVVIRAMEPAGVPLPKLFDRESKGEVKSSETFWFSHVSPLPVRTPSSTTSRLLEHDIPLYFESKAQGNRTGDIAIGSIARSHNPWVFETGSTNEIVGYSFSLGATFEKLLLLSDSDVDACVWFTE